MKTNTNIKIIASIKLVGKDWKWEYHNFDEQKQEKILFEIDHATAKKEVKLHGLQQVNTEVKDDLVIVLFGRE